MRTEKKKKKIFSQEEIMKMLDNCYQKAIDGIPKVSPPIDRFADNYLQKHPASQEAAKNMIKSQISKCTASGFITGFGGAIALPVEITANVISVLYFQMRMIACTAYMAGLNIHSHRVRTLVYACLAEVSVNEVVKKTGVKLGEKVADHMVEKISEHTLVAINEKIGFKFVARFGEKGLINLGKLVPVVGAAINGGFDLVDTKLIGNRAYRMFFMGDFSGKDDTVTDSG